ncbi:hypothetical protein PIB30_092578 [Stylosanthes scabra]|uniref:Uncharacterized protein n=1 Tax=Stylosanthes scabra TaxID=79078 RepID=A0ABU6QW96_9FABA|nr:hypothetical protein [Stylosanthes scabra]
MCDGDEVEGKEVSRGISARVDEAKGMEEEDNNNNNNKKKKKKKKKKKIQRRTPLRKRCLLYTVLWTWMPTRITYSIWRSFVAIPSTLPFIVVRHLPRIPPTMHDLLLLTLAVNSALIYPAFGLLQLVRVVSTCRKSGCYTRNPCGVSDYTGKCTRSQESRPRLDHIWTWLSLALWVMLVNPMSGTTSRPRLGVA